MDTTRKVSDLRIQGKECRIRGTTERESKYTDEEVSHGGNFK